MPQNTVPRNLQGGPSFTYGERGPGGKGRPADIDEIIHLVRTQGIARESTEMRLTKKAPLPSIGQNMPSQRRRGSLGEPRGGRVHNGMDNNNASSSVDTDNTEGTDEAYEFDTEVPDLALYEVSHQNGPVPTIQPMTTAQRLSPHTNGGFSHVNQSIISRSTDAFQFGGSGVSPLSRGQKSRSHQSHHHHSRGKDVSPTRNPRAVRNLPPMLAHERSLGGGGYSHGHVGPLGHLPVSRPNAPSPSVTPPLSMSDENDEDTEDFIES